LHSPIGKTAGWQSRKREQGSIRPVKGRFAAVGGALGGLAVWRLLRRKAHAPAVPAPDPAAELRAKLEESKPLVTERESFEEAETTVDAAPDPESRRRDVHEAAMARIAELKRGSVSNDASRPNED
jgi:hypothetical protein